MKRILLFSAAFLLSATVIFAQGRKAPNRERPNPEERISKHLERLTEELALTETQQATIKKSMLDNHNAREAELETTGKREERRAIAQKYREQGKASLLAVLTPEQVEKLKAMKKERKTERKDRKACRKECAKGKQ